MLQWLRARAAGVAVATLVWTATVTGAAAAHAGGCHDTACGSAAVAHDASAHRVGAVSNDPASHPLHCLVCHWVRAFRPPTEARFVSAVASDAGVRLPVRFITVAGRAPVAQPPLRSPPV